MVKGLSTARARVAASVKLTDNVNVDHRPALVYGAISSAKELMEEEEDNYDKLPAFLRSFARENRGSTVSCQLDSRGRFYRAFLSFGSLIAGQDNWVPLLECDGTHMKHARYNGVCLLVIGKDRDWGNIPVAVAFVRKETADNFECFFASCVVVGIKLHDRPLFSDRGKQRDAQVRLRVRGVPIHLKFCALHIFFNVCGHFRSIEPNIASIRSLILSLQATTTSVEYDAVLTEINKRFPAERTVTVNGKQEKQSVAQYLRKIHPSSWIKFGNDNLTPEETSAVKAEWGSVEAFGDGCPLFGGRTTSAVESQNRALLLSGVRDSQVFGAVVLFCNVVVKTIAAKKENARDWMGAKHTVTPRVKAKFDDQIWSASAFTVRKNSESVFYVENEVASVEDGDALLNNGSRTFTVDLQTGTCIRCPDRHQMQIPCRHIVAALHAQSGSSGTSAGACRFFHHAFTAPSYAQAFQHVAISLPFVPALMPDPHILPLPLYNQGGGVSRAARRDIATREKRIRSTGEPNTSRPRRHPKQKATTSSERAAVLASMHDLFSSEIRAEQTKKRKNYTCSLCGKAERHNAAKCPNRAKGTVDDDVRARICIVGSCPLELLERRNSVSITEAQDSNSTILSEYTF